MHFSRVTAQPVIQSDLVSTSSQNILHHREPVILLQYYISIGTRCIGNRVRSLRVEHNEAGEENEPVFEALSPFRNIGERPLPISGYDKPSLPQVKEDEDEIE